MVQIHASTFITWVVFGAIGAPPWPGGVSHGPAADDSSNEGKALPVPGGPRLMTI